MSHHDEHDGHDGHDGHDHQHTQDGHQEVLWTAEFWDERYGSSEALWSGNANPVLRTEVTDLPPSRALDVGCGEGGDVLWLATRGWQVEGVDVSQVALDRAAAHAAAAGADVAARTTWTQRDLLAWTPPQAAYDLVTVSFFQLPSADRVPTYAGLAAAVAPGGTFLVLAHHASDLAVVPRTHDPDLFFTPEELAEQLDDRWEVVTCEARPRTGAHPDGYEVTLHDTVLRARRLP